MGWRYRKSVKILPGVKLNFNKKSTSISFGGKGHHTTINSKGKATRTVGIPGTGLYHTSTISSKRASRPVASKQSWKGVKTMGVILQVFSVIMLVLSLLLAFITPAGWVLAVFAVLLFLMGRKYKAKAAEMGVGEQDDN